MVLGLLRDTVGNIAGNLDQDSFVAGAENESRLQNLQRMNQNRINRDFFRDQQGGPPAIPTPTALNQGMAGLNLDNFGGTYIDVPPPVVDQEGGAGQGLPFEDSFYQDKILRDQERMQQGQLGTAPPVVPEFDSSKTVINPSDNQNLPNNQIPIPQFQNPDLSALFPEGVVSENDVSDEEKTELHVQGMPWKVIDKNGGKIVIHNGVEYDIKDVFGDGSSLMLVDRFGRPNQVLTDAFTKARARGITNTEIVPRTSSSQDDLAAATVDNSFISNALKTIKEDKFNNGFSQATVNYARLFGIDEGEALGLLAVESNFGTVDFSKRGSTRGPLQIQNLAYKDIKSFYKGNNPANSGLTDIQWNQMVDIVKNLPKNHANLNNSGDQIAAGLLYYKMIGLKGVDPKFQAAAYYDGYAKYIGINDISDVKKFSGPNTLASVTKYNSAVLGMKDYLGQVSNYYYPVGGAPSAAANNQNTQTTTSSAVTNNQTSGQTTTASNNQNQQNVTAGLKTVDAQTDTSAQSANTGNQSVASGDVSSLQIQSGVDTGDIKTEEKVPKADPKVKPPAFYTNDPSKLGFDLRNYLEERSLIINQTNQNVQILAQRSDYFRRLAEVSRIGGTDEESYNQLINQSTELMAKAQTMQQAGALEAKKAENKIMYLQGMQGLQDLANGSVNRAAMVWSEYSGMKIRINPRSDGKYDVTINDKPYKTYDLKTLSDTLQLAFDQGYRRSQQEAATTRALKSFEAQLDILKEQYKSYNTRQEKLLQGRIDILKKREEQIGDVELKVDTNSGVVYIKRGNSFFMLEVFEDKTLDGKTVEGVREVPVQPPANLTPSGNAYKREKK